MAQVNATPASSAEDTSLLSKWTSTFSALLTAPTATTDADRDAKDCARCEAWRDNLLESSPIVRFLTQHDALLSADGKGTPIHCLPCDETQASGFNHEHGIMLCQNRIPSKRFMEDALSHELVHAYDSRRFKIDWSNLRHHACTEVGLAMSFTDRAA